ncbi:two-component system response regulator BtsR [Vibrio nigripulchritudo]|uniref:two-component system response regulator BtsR n=1 Tax=Vibrio nigripulchritudo TaxID=28173 RepID=UPI0003B22B61|nr:two-component system response regulator BtsR [Vibrio nigripulchritudo]CCN71330.1 putative Response regulator of the LytR family [Vibrio nigripulchritudo SFn118]
MLTAIVIDDELFAREELTELLLETQKIEIIDQASNAIEGLKKIHSLKPDVVFLDIHMPQVSGIELLSMLAPDNMPNVVFVTAYDQYAIQAFEENAFDYLLKPVEQKRLEKCVARLVKTAELKQPVDYSPMIKDKLEQVPCVGHNRIVIFPIAEVEFAFTDISGVQVKTAEQTATSQLTLKILEQKTPLLRCHRQYLVNTQAIREIKLLEHGLAEIITHSGKPVPVSRRYLKSLKETLGIQ